MRFEVNATTSGDTADGRAGASGYTLPETDVRGALTNRMARSESRWCVSGPDRPNAGDLPRFVGQAVQTCRVRSETWQLVTKRAPFVLLTGDSGTGKTSVLLESQTEYGAATLAPPPTACMFDSGALQVALLDALSAAMAMHDSEESGWRKLGNRITHASRETAFEMGKSLRDALVQELLNLVKSRLGQDVGQGLLAFVKGLRSDDRETLRLDIRSRSDGNVVRLLVRLADEVAETLDRDIVIALDDADRLSDADQRILAWRRCPASTASANDRRLLDGQTRRVGSS